MCPRRFPNTPRLGKGDGGHVGAKYFAGADVELFLDAGAELGEGPVWDDRCQVLWWVDIAGGRVHRCSPAGRDRVVMDVDVAVGSVALTESDDTVVVAAGRDLVLLHPTGNTSHLITVGDVVDRGVLNDCSCDPAGNLWVGVSTEEEIEPIGCLRAVTPALEVTTVLGGLIIPNGIDWSPDGRWMYFADSPDAARRCLPSSRCAARITHDARSGRTRPGRPGRTHGRQRGRGLGGILGRMARPALPTRRHP